MTSAMPMQCLNVENASDCCVLVVSPLNAIVSDQIEKLKKRIVVFKRGNDQNGVLFLDDSVKFACGHAEAFVEHVWTLLKSFFKNRVSLVIIDEAHLIIQCE